MTRAASNQTVVEEFLNSLENILNSLDNISKHKQDVTEYNRICNIHCFIITVLQRTITSYHFNNLHWLVGQTGQLHDRPIFRLCQKFPKMLCYVL